jgi:adenosylhomocysteine nucleosidase
MRLLLVIALLGSPLGATDLLIQGALDWELQPLLAALEHKDETRIGPWTFWTGKIGTKSVVLSRTEMGPINAAASTALAIEAFRPAAIINQGTAGAHNPKLGVWDIVVGERTRDYGGFESGHGDEGAGIDHARWKPASHRIRLDNRLTDFPSFPGDADLVAAALRVPYRKGRVVKGTIGSAFEYNRELDRIKWIAQTYGTDSEDMESAFVAGVAAAMKVRFVAIRIISDSEWNHPELEKGTGESCAKFVVDFVKSMK